MKNRILIISVCKEKLHELEFVKPIEEILKKNKIGFFSKHYKEVYSKDLEKCSKVIICGTSLKDNKFIEDMGKFYWIKNFNKQILGICAGMQLIGLIYGGKVNIKNEIGFYDEKFKESFLGLKEEIQVYHLHNNYVDFSSLKDFDVYCDNIYQAVKHKEKEIYGVLFHPEVRNKELIINFVNL